jgi:hypothetical protein
MMAAFDRISSSFASSGDRRGGQIEDHACRDSDTLSAFRGLHNDYKAESDYIVSLPGDIEDN